MSYESDKSMRLVLGDLGQKNLEIYQAARNDMVVLIAALMAAAERDSFQFGPMIDNLRTLNERLYTDLSTKFETGLEGDYIRIREAWVLLDSFLDGIEFMQKRWRE